MNTTIDINQINKELEIVKLNGQKFAVAGGYIMPSGYAFHHPRHGFIAFTCDGGRPYTPIGGKQALESILAAGGFVSFEGMTWLRRM